MSFHIQLLTMIIPFLIIVIPIWMIRGTHGILRVISILFAGFIGFLGIYYLINFLNFSDFSESIIKPIYLSFLIATGLLILITQKKKCIEYRFFKNTINKQ
ncbi:MAG: hypothetical protein ACXW0J_07640 [Nitrososphaeraceae archaeon]